MNIVIGLIGDVCAGKSTVSEYFKDRGAFVYNADKAVHLLYYDEEVKRQVVELFGPSVLTNDAIDRKILGDIVFPSPEKMNALGDIIYPRIDSQIKELVNSFKTLKSQEMLLLDVPLLVKAHMEDCCDKLVFVTANSKRRQDWAINNRGWTSMDLMRRDALLAEPILKKHDVITNNGTKEELEAQVETLIHSWRTLPKKWTVKRQDDVGNVFEVEGGLERKVADALFAKLEVKGHKQFYFIEEEK